MIISSKRRDVYKDLLLYCTYYNDVDDVWIVPLKVDVFYRVRINDETALKPLYYTPERPLIKISYPIGSMKPMFYLLRDFLVNVF